MGDFVINVEYVGKDVDEIYIVIIILGELIEIVLIFIVII